MVPIACGGKTFFKVGGWGEGRVILMLEIGGKKERLEVESLT